MGLIVGTLSCFLRLMDVCLGALDTELISPMVMFSPMAALVYSSAERCSTAATAPKVSASCKAVQGQ